MTIKEQQISLKIIKELRQNKDRFTIKVSKTNVKEVKKVLIRKICEVKNIYFVKDISIIEIPYNFFCEYKIHILYKFNLKQEKIISAYLEDIIAESQNKIDIVKEIYNYVKNDYVYNKKQHDFIKFLIDGEGDYYCFSLLFNLICNKYNINNILLEGYLNYNFKRNYIWNFVEIDGLWYNIDVSLDTKNNTNNYFLKPDVFFYKHIRNNKYVTDNFYNTYKSAQLNYGETPVCKVLEVKQCKLNIK